MGSILTDVSGILYGDGKKSEIQALACLRVVPKKLSDPQETLLHGVICRSAKFPDVDELQSIYSNWFTTAGSHVWPAYYLRNTHVRNLFQQTAY